MSSENSKTSITGTLERGIANYTRVELGNQRMSARPFSKIPFKNEVATPQSPKQPQKDRALLDPPAGNVGLNMRSALVISCAVPKNCAAKTLRKTNRCSAKCLPMRKNTNSQEFRGFRRAQRPPEGSTSTNVE